MNWLLTSLRSYPEIVVFFAVGVGYWVGNYKIRNFSLGAITASLMAGLLIGNLHIDPSRDFRWGFREVGCLCNEIGFDLELD